MHRDGASAGAALDVAEQARTLDNPGIVALVTGRLDEATRLFGDAMTRYEAAGDRRGVAVALEHRATALISQGDLDTARQVASSVWMPGVPWAISSRSVTRCSIWASSNCSSGSTKTPPVISSRHGQSRRRWGNRRRSRTRN
jgi:hypothetical protein